VSVAEPPGDTAVPPLIWSVGTLLLLIVVCAEAGEPTTYPVPLARDSVRVLLGFTTSSTRVGTDTDTVVALAGRTTEEGGTTMSLLSAVPPDMRLTVMSLALAAVAVITNAAGVPSETSASTDWIESVGVVSWARSAVKMPWWTTPVVFAVVCPGGGPIMSPAAV
jgi:hypothetical protein